MGPDFQGRVFSEKKAAGRLKPRQRGLANRICFYQNPQIPESQIPNLQISKFPQSQKCKSGSLQCWMKKLSICSDCRFLKSFGIGKSKTFKSIRRCLRTDFELIGHHHILVINIDSLFRFGLFDVICTSCVQHPAAKCSCLY